MGAAHTFEKGEVEIFGMVTFQAFNTIVECVCFLALAVTYLAVIHSAAAAGYAIVLSVVPVARKLAGHTSLPIEFGLVERARCACFQTNIVDLVFGATQAQLQTEIEKSGMITFNTRDVVPEFIPRALASLAFFIVQPVPTAAITNIRG